jgi:hypothetical protein
MRFVLDRFWSVPYDHRTDPFTLSSAPQEDTATLHIRVRIAALHFDCSLSPAAACCLRAALIVLIACWDAQIMGPGSWTFNVNNFLK